MNLKRSSKKAKLEEAFLAKCMRDIDKRIRAECKKHPSKLRQTLVGSKKEE